MKKCSKKIILAAFFLLLILSYGYYHQLGGKMQQGMDKHVSNFNLLYDIETNVEMNLTDDDTDSQMPQSSPAAYYCNFPPRFSAREIEEGEGMPEWKLLQAQIAIRHGDRTSMNAKRNLLVRSTLCNIYKDPLVQKYPILQEFRDFISNQKSSYSKSFLVPMLSRCPQSYLTVIGVLQQLQNGMALRKAYSDKLDFIVNGEVSKFKILSTSYPRTIQSAIALMYGLFRNFNTKKIPLSSNHRVTFCPTNCNCKRESSYQSQIKSVTKRLIEERHQNIDTLQRIASFLDIPNKLGPQMDRLVTGTFCKGLELPCDSAGRCVTENDLDVIMDEQEYQIKFHIEETPLQNQSMLRMQPMLNKILKFMKSAKDRNSNSVKMVLYSGHDVTIRPLLRALDISDYRWPRLGSRFVFELWEHSQRHYVKFILNGKDVTASVSFCSGKNSCRLEDFSQFVLKSIFEQFGAKSLEEACSVT